MSIVLPGSLLWEPEDPSDLSHAAFPPWASVSPSVNRTFPSGLMGLS